MEFAPALEIWFGGLDDSIPVRRASLSSLLPDAIAMSDLPSMRSS